MPDRKSAESAIRRSEARLSGILAIAADAIISIDEQQRIVMFNHGAEAIFGFTAAEVMGQPLHMLLPPRFRATHGGHIRRFAGSGSMARRMGERQEIFGLRKNGQEFPAEASISTLDMEGERTFTVVLRDITDRKQVCWSEPTRSLRPESRSAQPSSMPRPNGDSRPRPPSRVRSAWRRSDSSPAASRTTSTICSP
jgi:PAS domain S-box-containing protein